MTDLLPPTAAGLERAAAILAAGGLVAFPTDTVHGVACRPGDPDALNRIYELKQRPPELRIPMLVPSLDAVMATGYTVDDRARRLVAAFWPGGLTLVLARRAGNGQATQAFRAPDHDTAMELLALAGPLMTTSANLSGQPETWSTEDVLVAFAGADDLLDAVVEGHSSRGVASSIIDLTEPTARLLREGPISRAQLAEVVELAP